ncbi:MAG: hypothetical protein M1416_01120 [Candidatus Pacearchaeota archaeon]|nr:hypothetical protein [Candidatus Pacearchaeota archaeon]
MAKKKRMKRTAPINPKTIAKKSFSKYKRATSISDKIKLVVNNLLLFIALSLVSFVLYRFIENKFLNDLFFVIAIVFGFIGAGFLIVLLILAIMKLISKKR